MPQENIYNKVSWSSVQTIDFQLPKHVKKWITQRQMPVQLYSQEEQFANPRSRLGSTQLEIWDSCWGLHQCKKRSPASENYKDRSSLLLSPWISALYSSWEDNDARTDIAARSAISVPLNEACRKVRKWLWNVQLLLADCVLCSQTTVL
jgi:hypothetical protein